MICKVSCSIGELIDKISILNIKLEKSDNEKKNNISKELNILNSENPISNINDSLFSELEQINKKLWELEDNIRIKSKNKEFDDKYIEICEDIHKTNDIRYIVKRKINTKYSSELKEEKIYSNSNNISNEISNKVDCSVLSNLEKGKNLYQNGEYKESYQIINKIMTEYENYDNYDSFYVDLLFSYSNVNNIFGFNNPHNSKIELFMKTIDNCKLSVKQILFCKQIYVMNCLNNSDYNHAKKYLGYFNSISGPNVNSDNISFFKTNDFNKTLLIYDGGGFGDKFMFCRFIPFLCEKYKTHNIIFIVDRELIWIFNKLFENISNLNIFSYDKLSSLPKFDYHTNLIKLIDYLNYDYCNLPKQLSLDPILNNNICDECKHILTLLKSCNKKKYILNWFGGTKNKHEKYNRRMNLSDLIPVLELENIQWIVISKNVSDNEKKLLSEYNVLYCGHILDNSQNAFQDSINIIKNVDALISTDTCLVHISPCLNIKTFVLLTIGNEWRWKTNNWYPNSILIKQKVYGVWKDVVNELITQL